jgi:CheY-like chemotaxis protein
MPTSTVLVVEDDLSTQNLLVAIIKHLGLQTTIAGDGRAALEMLAKQTPDAILLDLIMPRVDGFEVLRQMKRKAPELLSRTIVVTAAAIRNVDEIPELALVREFLRKPLDIDQLSACLLDCIAGRTPKTDRGAAYETPPRP